MSGDEMAEFTHTWRTPTGIPLGFKLCDATKTTDQHGLPCGSAGGVLSHVGEALPKELRVGMAVLEVNGEATGTKPFEEVLAMLKSDTRPLIVRFGPPLKGSEGAVGRTRAPTGARAELLANLKAHYKEGVEGSSPQETSAVTKAPPGPRWMCERKCGFESADFNAVVEHEKHCTYIRPSTEGAGSQHGAEGEAEGPASIEAPFDHEGSSKESREVDSGLRTQPAVGERLSEISTAEMEAPYTPPPPTGDAYTPPPMSSI